LITSGRPSLKNNSSDGHDGVINTRRYYGYVRRYRDYACRYIFLKNRV
jgi:hypothetical protein